MNPPGSTDRGDAKKIGEFPGGRDDVRRNGDRPERQLIPREQVSAEAEEDRQAEQHDPHQPVDPACSGVAGGEKDPEEMKDDHGDHRMCSPPVHIPDMPTPGDDRGDVLDGPVRLFDGGNVIHHQEDPRQQKDQEEGE